jgi:hypothetical protein
MHASLPKLLVAIALTVPAPSAFADVITDWNEKAVAFVTPRMPPPAAQRVVTMVSWRCSTQSTRSSAAIGRI